MRANTRPRVSAPTSEQPRTTFDTVMTETFSSCAMSFRRTGELGGLDMSRQCAHRHARTGKLKREYTKLGIGGWDLGLGKTGPGAMLFTVLRNNRLCPNYPQLNASSDLVPVIVGQPSDNTHITL